LENLSGATVGDAPRREFPFRSFASSLSSPTMFSSEINRFTLSASAHGHGCGRRGHAGQGFASPARTECLSTMSTFLAGKQIEVMNGYAERNLAHKPA